MDFVIDTVGNEELNERVELLDPEDKLFVG